MKYSYNWLKELSQTKLLPEKMAELLTMHSFEIEGLEKNEKKLEGVIVGEILEIKKHPNADKLQIAIVEIGKDKSIPPQYSPCILDKRGYEGKDCLKIVCGAPNIAVGQKVPVATVGTILPGGEIKEAEIRGEKSFGMLCAEDELGLGKNHDGILILDKKAKIGEPVMKYLGLDDSVIEIKVLPDRAHDILSHVGVAREIAVLERRRFDYDYEGLRLPRIKSLNNDLSIQIKDKKLCRRYIGAVMENVEIKESPKWLRDRLEACGLRPINNVVDATNYIMLETGQPLHAFDIEKVKSQKSKIKGATQNLKVNIIVRRAKKDEKMVLLDDTEIKLNEDNLLITNGETPLALAGVMGGKDSGIDENTKTIVIESASFDAINIRRTRTSLNLRTDSSDRFEKELDPNLTELAMTRIIEILEHIAGGKLNQIVDVYPEKIKPWKIKLDLNYADTLLGEKIPQKEIIRILNLLGIATTIQPYKVICTIPTFRVDLRTQEDLIEDIGRIFGYENILPQPMISAVLPAKLNKQLFFERKAQDILTGLGFDEVYNYSFYGKNELEKAGISDENHFELLNPMNPEQAYVRRSMIPNILKNVRENLKNFSEFGIFEIGKCYEVINNSLSETRLLTSATVRLDDKNAETFYELKGLIEDLLDSLNVRNYEFIAAGKIGAHINSKRAAKIVVNGNEIGSIGEISQEIQMNHKIAKKVVVADINLEMMRKASESITEYGQINKFPIVTRDLSMIMPENVSYAEICDAVKKTGGELVYSVSLFDYFKTKKSLAIRIELGSKDRTLESAEIEAMMEKIILKLENNLQVEVRR